MSRDIDGEYGVFLYLYDPAGKLLCVLPASYDDAAKSYRVDLPANFSGYDQAIRIEVGGPPQSEAIEDSSWRDRPPLL